MTAYRAWTPASRPGIVPLHPLGFGTILGRSFTALRQNPRVLLGFALCVQALAYLVILAVVGAVTFASFSRLDTVQPGTDDYDAVFAGSIALTLITALALSLAAGALTVIIQGVVVTEVASAVLAEKLTLGAIWRRVRPVAWRLLGYAALVTTAAVVAVAIVVGILFAIGAAFLPLAIVGGLLAALGAIVLAVWLTTKLLLVPAVIILENARIPAAMARSWRLIRGRFWPSFGVWILINLTFGTVAQLVAVPLTLLSDAVASIVAPTGDPETQAVTGLLITTLITQVLTLLIQCVALIVQSTAVTLVYVDARMRREGLDLDLQEYVERRDAGATALPDPYRVHAGREMAPRMPVPSYLPYPQGGPFPYPPPPAAYPPPPAGPGAAPPYAAASGPVPPPPPPTAFAGNQGTAAPAPPPAPSPTEWTAPGGPSGSER